MSSSKSDKTKPAGPAKPRPSTTTTTETPIVNKTNTTTTTTTATTMDKPTAPTTAKSKTPVKPAAAQPPNSILKSSSKSSPLLKEKEKESTTTTMVAPTTPTKKSTPGVITKSSSTTTGPAKTKEEEEVNKEYLRLLDQLVPYFWENPRTTIDVLNRVRTKGWPTKGNIFLNLRTPAHVYLIIWHLIKVGMTQVVDKETRPNQVVKDIKKAYPGTEPCTEPSIICNLMLDPSCTERINDAEDRIRKAIGHVLDIKDANKLKLPVPSEWCLVSDDRLKRIQRKLAKIPDQDIYNFHTQIFTGLRKEEEEEGVKEEPLDIVNHILKLKAIK
ncbi:hypothetical protein DFA_05388 [Cavenderia fasciculata]|uniref:Uncharacterized protein n=1 Tax=Cavenderia fasciculata TaxID=261658 RepID=F4PL34_CACFS|nr:uncharacterized protein DFA_05388 [Cavenderia fasciculata]EGG23256.1 hypothetical protein DFA_05388 [Cavenderia fasciculata]|eukprot:XP_004361107.1 hypothetical protein DFA_05388 [Cavenderia fasciculata]